MHADEHITLSRAAQLSPGHPHPSAAWRWCRRGILARSGERVHLRHIRAGGKIFTTERWLHAFFAAVADADSQHFAETTGSRPPLIKPRTSSNRRKANATAEAELNDAGIGRDRCNRKDQNHD